MSDFLTQEQKDTLTPEELQEYNDYVADMNRCGYDAESECKDANCIYKQSLQHRK